MLELELDDASRDAALSRIGRKPVTYLSALAWVDCQDGVRSDAQSLCRIVQCISVLTIHVGRYSCHDETARRWHERNDTDACRVVMRKE